MKIVALNDLLMRLFTAVLVESKVADAETVAWSSMEEYSPKASLREGPRIVRMIIQP